MSQSSYILLSAARNQDQTDRQTDSLQSDRSQLAYYSCCTAAGYLLVVLGELLGKHVDQQLGILMDQEKTRERGRV